MEWPFMTRKEHLRILRYSEDSMWRYREFYLGASRDLSARDAEVEKLREEVRVLQEENRDLSNALFLSAEGRDDHRHWD
jgi:cell division protein FtsB